MRSGVAERPQRHLAGSRLRVTMGGDEAKHKEWLSRAFVMAVAAKAGYAVEVQLNDLYGVDIVLRSGGYTVDIQLKATAVPHYRDDVLLFDLDVSTYNKLRTDRNSPGYLVVTVLPGDRARWVSHLQTQISVRHVAYWLEITGMPVTTNHASVRISIPLTNRVTERALTDMIAKAKSRAMA